MQMPDILQPENIKKAQQGDTHVREQLLAEGKPFVRQVVCNFCHRKLEWGQDDELSIGLIAMNEAIDRYSQGRQISFLAYARMVIKCRLKDFFRREARHNNLSFEVAAADDYESPQSIYEAGQAWDNYVQEVAARERQDEVMEFGQLLADHGLDFQELAAASPKHTDSRENLIMVAWQLANNQQMMANLLEKSRLPLTELVLATGVNRKTLERGRKYIMAMALLFYHRHRFIYIYSYLKLTNWKEGKACG